MSQIVQSAYSTKTANKRRSIKYLSILFFAALIVRAAVFFFYMQHEERYHQPDSNDYHVYATTIVNKTPMTRYWRTPGYPAYLAIFYYIFGFKPGHFSCSSDTHKAAIWGQIILNSFIPIILFFLAYLLTASTLIAWATAWISVFHIGLILASTYLLTEGIALIPFYLFLFFFYASFRAYGESPHAPYYNSKQYLPVALAALLLGLFTWMRPMGEFVAVVALLILFVCAKARPSIKLKKMGLFALLFFASTGPWYAHNYHRSGKIFFCPMFGSYLNCFTAPRILRDLHGMPLEKTWKHLQQKLTKKIRQEAAYRQRIGKPFTLEHPPVIEHIAGSIAWPIVMAHPVYACQEWMKEVCITAFDLTSYQFVALAKNKFKWDPLETFLSDRIAECLWRDSIPTTTRMLCWIDCIFSILIWLGLLIGTWLFLLQPLKQKFHVSDNIKERAGLYLKTGLLIGAIIFMTGGFGYARLRLPVEPLMIILALATGKFLLKNRKK